MLPMTGSNSGKLIILLFGHYFVNFSCSSLDEFISVTAVSADSARLRDFSDSLSPIVVKELRQALRGTGFIGQFCFIQAGLLLISLIQWHASEMQQEQWDDAFWGACVAALVVADPLAFLSCSFS